MKLGQKLKQLVGTVAPTLGAAMGGPLGVMAGNFVQEALGVDSEAAALKRLEGDPTALLTLRQAEMEFDKQMRALDIDVEKINAADRQNARGFAQSTSFLPQVAMSALFIVGYFGVTGSLIAGAWRPPDGGEQLTAALIGVLTAGVIKILDFWFGSSSGSKEKTAVLANGRNN